MSEQRPNLPPRYVNLPVNVLYNASIPDAAFRTFAEFVGFAWGKGNMASVSFEPSEFLQLTGKSERTLYGHLSILGTCGVLRYSAPKNGLWNVVFVSPTDETTCCNDLQHCKPLQLNTNNNNDSDSSLVLNDVEEIFRTITGMFTIPSNSRAEVEDAIRAIFAKLASIEAVKAYLQPYWDAWTAREYRKTNCNWLTGWAVSGEIPPAKKSAPETKTRVAAGDGYFYG